MLRSRPPAGGWEAGRPTCGAWKMPPAVNRGGSSTVQSDTRIGQHCFLPLIAHHHHGLAVTEERARGRTDRKIRHIAFPPIPRESRRSLHNRSVEYRYSRQVGLVMVIGLHRLGLCTFRSSWNLFINEVTILIDFHRSATLVGRRSCVCFCSPPASASGQHRKGLAHTVGGKSNRSGWLRSRGGNTAVKQGGDSERARTTLLGGRIGWLRDSHQSCSFRETSLNCSNARSHKRSFPPSNRLKSSQRPSRERQGRRRLVRGGYLRMLRSYPTNITAPATSVQR